MFTFIYQLFVSFFIGWQRRVYQRASGATIGKWDVYLTNSVTTKKFANKGDVQNFIDEYKLPYSNQDFEFGLDDRLKKLRQIWRQYKFSGKSTAPIVETSDPARIVTDKNVEVSQESQEYPCDKCAIVFQDQSLLSVHKRTKGYRRDHKNSCEYCEFFNCTTKGLAKHIENEHQAQVSKNNIKKEAIEKLCCDKCEFSFKTLENLRTHQNSKEYKENLKYDCDSCEMKLCTMASLVQHKIQLHGFNMKSEKQAPDSSKQQQPITLLPYLQLDLKKDPKLIAEEMVEGVNIPGNGMEGSIDVDSSNLPKGLFFISKYVLELFVYIFFQLFVYFF